MTPLASRLRPDTLEGFVGQEHLLGPGKILRQLIEQDQIGSMIFWGPPGVGKTTLARIIAVTELIKSSEPFMRINGLIWPLFYTGVFYLIFVGALTLLFNFIERKLSYFK